MQRAIALERESAAAAAAAAAADAEAAASKTAREHALLAARMAARDRCMATAGQRARTIRAADRHRTLCL